MQSASWQESVTLAGFTKLDLVTTMIGRALESVGDEQTAFPESARAADQRTGCRLLAVRNLSVGRKVTSASLQLIAGEIVGLAGLLGSGRTELARAVFGADRPDGGEMEFNGTAFAPGTPATAIAAGIGFCPEQCANRLALQLHVCPRCSGNVFRHNERRHRSFGRGVCGFW